MTPQTEQGTKEYGVRTYGGHVEAKPSRHVAVLEVEQRIAAGEKNVWLVERYVTDWNANEEQA